MSKPADGAEPEHAEEPRRRGLDELVGKRGSEEDYPELMDELKGIGDIADMLREVGLKRRRFGEDLMRLLDCEVAGSGLGPRLQPAPPGRTKGRGAPGE